MKKIFTRGLAVSAVASMMMSFTLMRVAHGSDHADTPDNAANPGQDISDVYVFPSPNNPNNVVLAMNVSPLITPNQVATRRFDRNVLYQFKIDNTGDAKEDRVIQLVFKGTGPNQTVEVRGPIAPPVQGAMANQVAVIDPVVSGKINTTLGSATGIQVFAGAREDTFFLDLETFFRIVPDRKP